MLRGLLIRLKASFHALKWGKGMLRGGRKVLWGMAANTARRNIGYIFLFIGVSAILRLKYLSASTSIAALSLVTLGSDVTLFSQFLKVARVFVSPLDDLFIGSILTVCLVIALLVGVWNVFRSRLDQLR